MSKYDENVFYVSLYTGPITDEMRQYKKTSYVRQTAFDFTHPVNNFLFNVGLQHDAFKKMVERGVVVVADEDLKYFAQDFMNEWFEDIRRAKSINPSRRKLQYDKEGRLEEVSTMERFKCSVKAMCALADMDFEETLAKMLE